MKQSTKNKLAGIMAALGMNALGSVSCASDRILRRKYKNLPHPSFPHFPHTRNKKTGIYNG